MRVASATIGGLGAAAGAIKGLFSALAALAMGLVGQSVNSFVVLWSGTEFGTALFCCIGLAGAGAALGRKHQTAAYLMVAGAVGVMVCATAYVLLQPVAMGPAFEPYLSPGLIPDSTWHVQALFSVPFLLIGALLAVLAALSRSDTGPPKETA